MIRDLLASQAAKLVAACVCPAVGSAALTLGVPPVRSAIHRMTAPPERIARAGPRVRSVPKVARAPVSAGPEILCPTPVAIPAADFAAQPLSEAALAEAMRPGTPGRPSAMLPQAAGGGQAGGAQAGPVFGGGGGGFAGSGSGGGGTGGAMPPQALTQPPTPTAVVPEPAAWALLIAGFGLIGGALRLRRSVRRPARR